MDRDVEQTSGVLTETLGALETTRWTRSKKGSVDECSKRCERSIREDMVFRGTKDVALLSQEIESTFQTDRTRYVDRVLEFVQQ